MEEFAVISKMQSAEIEERYPIAKKIKGIENLILPYKDDEFFFNEIKCGKIVMFKGLEKSKLKYALNLGIRQYGYVVSKQYDINYNSLFYLSCLIRALDFYTVRLGCDLRLNEVVIADGASNSGKNAFKLLLPFARRIVLVTQEKDKLYDEVKYEAEKYGTSVAVLEDAVKAGEHADVVVLSSDDENHKYLSEISKPMLYIKYIHKPERELWFNDVTVRFEDYLELKTDYAQGYLDVIKKPAIFKLAEGNGFMIDSIKKDDVEVFRT